MLIELISDEHKMIAFGLIIKAGFFRLQKNHSFIETPFDP